MAKSNGSELKLIIKRFTWVFLASTFLLGLFVILLESFAGISVPATATTFLPTITSIYGASQLFVKTFRRESTPSENAHLAKMSTFNSAIVFLVLLFLVLLMMRAGGGEEANEVLALLANPIALTMMLVALSFLFVLIYFLSRFFYRISIRNLIKTGVSVKS